MTDDGSELASVIRHPSSVVGLLRRQNHPCQEQPNLAGAAWVSAGLVDALPPASAAHAYFCYPMYSIHADIGDNADLRAAFADGQRLPLAQAIAEALAEGA